MKELHEIFEDYAYNKMDTGLVLFPLPTGIGKSTAIFQFIYKILNENKHTDKILFITSLKKNLQISELRQIFIDNDKEELFNDKVLLLKSNYDCVMETLPKLLEDKKIPKEILDEEVFIKLRRSIELVKKLKENSNYLDFLSDKEEQIRTELEPNFRKFIKSFVKKSTESVLGKNRTTYSEKLFYIRENMSWLLELYPQILLNEKQVYIMSMDKFLVKTDTIIEPSFFTYIKLAKDAIIFIDEFDSTKETILNRFIENAARNKIDCVSAFRIIHDKLALGDFPLDLLKASEKLLVRKNDHKIIENEIDTLRKKCNVKYDKFKLQYTFKNNSNEINQQTFLFQDTGNIFVSNKQKSANIVYITNDEKKENEIVFSKDNTDNTSSLIYMLREVVGFLNYFCKGVYILAINYVQLKQEQKIEFSLEDAINSILDIFFPDKKSGYKDYFKEKILLNNTEKNSTKGSLFEESFFENGFRYYTIEDKDDHDFRSVILSTSLEITPEKLLLDICKKARVFGLSATANYDSLIGNYSLSNYIISKLKKHYYILTDDEQKILEDSFNDSVSHYDKVKIHSEKINNPENYGLNNWIETFGDEKGECLFNIIQQTLSSKKDNDFYLAKRYLRIAKVFKKFIETENIYSFLCLFNLFPKDQDFSFDSEIIEKLFNYIADEKYSYSENVVILRSGASYETEKSLLQKRLSNGEKILIISTYATLGAGQNLQYKIPDCLKYNVVKINDFTSSEYKDLDGIYLENPTNLLLQLETNKTYESLIKYITQIEYLKEAGELSFAKGKFYIENAFKTICFGQKENINIKRTDIESYSIYASKVIVQAIGRICRTNMKNPNIYIFYDSSIENYINRDICEQNLLSPEFKCLLEGFDIKENNTLEIRKRKLEISATNHSIVVLKQIYNFINNVSFGYWTDKEIEEWQKIRFELLQKPTLTLDEYNNCDDIIKPFYLELDSPGNKYWFKREGDYKEMTDISFTENASYELVSSDKARLDKFLKINEVAELFQKNNFSESFKENKFILCPPAYTNIYKGALGEYAGKAILNQNGITLEDITDNNLFELFDFKIPDKNIYVDFKHWNEYSFYMPKESEIKDKIVDKLKRCSGKVALIINIFTEHNYKIKIQDENGLKIIEIPYLYNQDTLEFNNKAIKAIKKIIEEN